MLLAIFVYWLFCICIGLVNKKDIYRKKENVVAQRVSSEMVLVPLVDNIADFGNVYSLNEVSAYLWDQISGTLSIEDIANELSAEYDVDEEIAIQDTKDLFARLMPFLEKV
ncbi:MAG: hypothetical protein C0594_08115 [Marinilabiliales bacterium]|nr:MAG: hypothetical protein C0594_08115 [Marinilabiliales bacterium]